MAHFLKNTVRASPDRETTAPVPPPKKRNLIDYGCFDIQVITQKFDNRLPTPEKLNEICFLFYFKKGPNYLVIFCNVFDGFSKGKEHAELN